MPEFEIVSKMVPKGDQPQAIDKLAGRVDAGERYSTLRGVTGVVLAERPGDKRFKRGGV